MEPTGRIFNIQKFSLNDGPGIRTTVFFAGCPLRCRWCANPESQTRYAKEAAQVTDEAYQGKTVSVEDVMAQVRRDKPFYDESGGGMTLSGGEPLLQPAFARALSEAAKQEGITVAMETSGFAEPEAFASATQYTDLLLFDIKHYDNAQHMEGTGVPNVQILENLKHALADGKQVIARIPVIPGFNARTEDAQCFARFLAPMGIHEVHLLPFHQLGQEKYHRLGVPYAYDDEKQLHPEDLASYQDAFTNEGLECTIH